MSVEAGDHPPRARGLGKLEMDPPGARVDLDPIDLVEHLDPALDLARLRRLIAEAVDEALDLGHALGLVARPRLEERVPGLPLDEEMIVVAGVDGDGAPDQVGDRRHHAVQEVPVVGDEHHACRRRRRESSPATRGTRDPGDWSARRAAGGPGRSSSRRASAARMRHPPENCASGRWTSSGLKPSPLRMTLAWASRRYPPRASKRCWTSPYRSSRAGSASGRAMSAASRSSWASRRQTSSKPDSASASTVGASLLAISCAR